MEPQAVTQRSSRPRVFISSTIHDFRDLRSALKYWLEELGFEVALSEFTDFPRRPDDATFDSCFQAIDDSDYYVLMIGARVGSEYEPRVSVTRAEFRRALERAREGKLKLALFVRTDVKSKLRERRAAAETMRGAGIDPSEIASSLERADEIQSFVDEVEATGPPGPRPHSAGSTWLYEFSSFGELADALRQTLRITGSIRRQAVLANLKLEIERDVGRVSTNNRGTPSPQHVLVEKLRREVELTPQNFEHEFKFSYEQAVRLGMFFLGGYSTVPLSTVALGDCIRSGEFLEYDPIAGQMEAGPMQQRLLELQEWIAGMASRAEWLAAQKDEAAGVVAQLASRRSTITVSGQLNRPGYCGGSNP